MPDYHRGAAEFWSETEQVEGRPGPEQWPPWLDRRQTAHSAWVYPGWTWSYEVADDAAESHCWRERGSCWLTEFWRGYDVVKYRPAESSRSENELWKNKNNIFPFYFFKNFLIQCTSMVTLISLPWRWNLALGSRMMGSVESSVWSDTGVTSPLVATGRSSRGTTSGWFARLEAIIWRKRSLSSSGLLSSPSLCALSLFSCSLFLVLQFRHQQ